MEQKVFITKTASYFPNEPVGNEEMEDGEKISLLVPESGRFSYGVCCLPYEKSCADTLLSCNHYA